MKHANTLGAIMTLAAAGFWLGSIASASATLTLTTANAAYFDSGSANLSADQIAADVGVTTADLGSVLFDTDGNSGPLINSYSFSPKVSGALPITISYVAGQTVADATYLYVKDGSSGGYIFNLGSSGADALGWNGTDSIYIQDLFGKGAGDLSHLEMFGSSGGSSQGNGGSGSVPEPSTIFAAALLLLPFGMSTVRILRKSRAS